MKCSQDKGQPWMPQAVSGVEEAQEEGGSKQSQFLNGQEAGLQFNNNSPPIRVCQTQFIPLPLNILPGKISSITVKLKGFYSEHITLDDLYLVRLALSNS